MTETGIANAALSILGEQATVVSVDPPQGGPYAEAVASFFPQAKATVLSEHNWSFATRRAALVLQSTQQDGAHIYALGSDMLRVLDVYPKDYAPEPGASFDIAERYTGFPAYPWNAEGRLNEFWIEGETIRTWVPEAEARYISANTPVSKFSPTAVRALTWRLAADLVGPLRRSMEQMPQVEQMYLTYLERAKFEDVREIQTIRRQRAPWHENRR